MSQSGDVTHRSFSTSSARALHFNIPPTVIKDSPYSWVVCVAAFIVQTITVGILNAFGVIFVALLEEFEVSKAELSWIASLAFGLSLGLGPIAGAFRLRFGVRGAISTGGLICAGGLLASSFVPTTAALFGTFSLLYAIGGSLIINSTTILSPDYFDKYVAITTGIIVAGASVGTLLFSCLAEIWVASVGWRNTFRIYAGISLTTVCMGLLMRPVRRPVQVATPTPSVQSSTPPRIKLWQNRLYIIWVISITCSMFGYYIPYVHLISYAVDIGLTKEQGSILIMVLGGTSAFARLVFGKVLSFQFLKRRELHQLSMMITATSTMMVTISDSMGGLLVYVIVLGLVDGCNVVLLPLLTRTYAGDCNVPIAWGILNGFSSVTFILGPPVAGWLYDATGNYNISFHVAGIPVITGAAVLFFIPWAKHTTPKPPQMTNAGPETLNNQINRENFPPIDSSHVIVGLPLAEHRSYADSLENTVSTNTSQTRNGYPDEHTGLKEEPWGWRSSQHCIANMEIEIPPAQLNSTELNKSPSIGLEIRSSSVQSTDGFVFLNKPEENTITVNQDDLHVSQMTPTDEEIPTVENNPHDTPPVLTEPLPLETLVKLDNVTENQLQEPPVENLVPINENLGAVNQSFQEQITTEENATTNFLPSPEDGVPATVVLPDFVVEKLVELNENEQNKTNSDATVETLVHFEDVSAEKNGAIKTASGDNQLAEKESTSATDYASGNRPFTRQPSESQCVLPSSVVETLASLAQNPTESPESSTNEETSDSSCVVSASLTNTPRVSEQSQTTWSTEATIQQQTQDQQKFNKEQAMWPANNIAQTEYINNDERQQQSQVWTDPSSTFPVVQSCEKTQAETQWTSSLSEVVTSVAMSNAIGQAGSGFYQNTGSKFMQARSETSENILAPHLAANLPVPVVHSSAEMEGWTIVSGKDHPNSPMVSNTWRQTSSHTSVRDQQFAHNSFTAPISATAGQWINSDTVHGISNQNPFHESTDQTSAARFPSSSPQVYSTGIAAQSPAPFSTALNTNTPFSTWTTGDVPVVDNSTRLAANLPNESNLAGLEKKDIENWWNGENNAPSVSKVGSTEMPTSTVWCTSSAEVDKVLPNAHEQLQHSLQFANDDKTRSPVPSPPIDTAGNPFIEDMPICRKGSQEFAMAINTDSAEGNQKPLAQATAQALDVFDQFWPSRPSGSQTDTTENSQDVGS